MNKILVVDDDKDFLKIVTKILEVGGFAVTTSENATDALQKIDNEIFDVLISDANMPGGSGFNLIKTLKKNYGSRNMSIALLTGRREKKDIEYGLSCGADDYIVKPLDPDLFLAKIETLLPQKRGAPHLEINFSESPVHVSAKWEVNTQIVRISEKGLTMWAPIVAPPNSKLKIASPLFSQIGIEPPNLRVLRCAADKTAPFMFFTSVTFVGLTESELQQIRYWINMQMIQSKELKAA